MNEPYWKKHADNSVLRRTFKLIRGARSRAKARGIPFDLVPSDVVIPDLCPILGVPFQMHTGKMNRYIPSLDRIDAKGGYTKDNVRVISWWANYLKEQLTLEQAKNLVKYMEGK